LGNKRDTFGRRLGEALGCFLNMDAPMGNASFAHSLPMGYHF